MFLKWLVCVAVLHFTPDFVNSTRVSARNKRSDDFIPCEKGWFLFREKCYKVGGRGSDTVTWETAVERCKSYGGDLVSIQSKEEQDFIISFLLLDIKSNVWIGLHDRVNESEYTWNDGSVVNYTNWKANEPTGPKDDKEDCVHMVFEPEHDVVGEWNDISCDHRYGYVCKMNTNKMKKSRNPSYCSFEEGGGWKYQNSCYHVVTEMKSWENAEKHCQDSFHGHLVTILDTTVDLFLDHVLYNIHKELWIGIKIQARLQQKWTSGWFVAYEGINKGPRDWIEGSCVRRKKRKEWTMDLCSKKHSFICEISKESPPILKLPPKGSHCPKELDDWRDLGGEYCYYIEIEKFINWYEALFECKRRGGNLLSLHSKEESDILHPFISYIKQRPFIGLYRLLADEKIFVWSDGSKKDYENWAPGEPNKPEEEKCVELRKDQMTWNDATCTDRKTFICGIKKIMPTQLQNRSTVEERTADCTGLVSVKVLVGVSVCIVTVIILLGVVVYCFRPWDTDRVKNSSTTPSKPSPPSKDRPRYRSATEQIIIKEDNQYEPMG